MVFVVYYSLIGLFFAIGQPYLSDASTNININSTSIQGSDLGSGSFADVLGVFGRFVAFTFFGLGLPTSTPVWFAVMVFAWQSILTAVFVAMLLGFARGG